MKLIPIIAAVLGLATTAALVGYFGAGAVIRSLRAIGWAGFLAICLIHLGVTSLEGIAWRLLVPGARVWALIWGRFIRDAGSEVLPVSQMGGCVLGARAVALTGVPGSVAAATTMVDLTLEFLAKLAYMAIGLILLVNFRPGMPVALPVTFGFAASGLFAIIFVLLQRRGFAILNRFAWMLGRGWAERTISGMAAVNAALAGTYRRSASLRGGFALHLACWVL
ncbi:MAG: flippase-like domain-containing protein, partial [Alphaproteobacteria bacterium]|nr:flippase-like domain-containing protein [Alphaproteobacteria bacterium]